MKYKLLIFDMDGTILNTLDDLTDTTNYALMQHKLPTHTLEEVRMMVGNGLAMLIEKAVPEGSDQALKAKVLETYLSYYKEHCADKTRPYEGICETIKKARDMGYKTAVVSNKTDAAVQSLCEDYFKGLFDASIGDKEGVRRKPYPDSVEAVLEMLKVDKADAVYIGDSDVDIMTAKNSGLDLIGVSWGFRGRDFLKEHGAQTIIDKAEQLFDFI